MTDREWLISCAGERMDATVPGIHQPSRMEFHLARYRFAAERVAGLEVADIACGTGYGTAVLASMARSVLGVDRDVRAVDYAGAHYWTEHTHFMAASADATVLPDADFDAVVSFETLEHVPDDAAVLSEFARILKPGGLLIASVPNNWGIGGHHVRNYTLDSFTAVLSEYFDVLEMYDQNSGDGGVFNHGRPAGITTTFGPDDAECFIAVCRRMP